MGIYVNIFIFSVVYTCRKLSGPGMSKEVRNLILKRHILTSVLFLVFNQYIFATAIIQVLPEW